MSDSLRPEIEEAWQTGGDTGGSDVAGADAYAGWAPESEVIAHRGTWSEVWRRFRKDKFAVAGLAAIIILVLVAIFAKWIAPYDPTRQFDDGITMRGLPVGPSSKFLLGTDTLGRDMLSRLIYGARASLVVGILANGIALFLGLIFGLVAGYSRGWSETLIMRATDVMMAFPILLFAAALVAVLPPSIWILVVVIAIVYWTPMTRVIHGEVLSLREKEFVDAARLTGCSTFRILYRHLLPHLIAPVIVYTSLGIATTVLFEATLSYLGLGIQPPTPSWGGMISDGQAYYLVAPGLMLWPGLCILVTVLAFNLVGDGMRDAFDPQQRGR